MKIEITIKVSNAPDDLSELVTRATGQNDYLADLVTGRTVPKDNKDAALDLLETWRDLLQVCDGLKYDIDRAVAHMPFHPERVE